MKRNQYTRTALEHFRTRRTFAAQARRDFYSFIGGTNFPCLGAKAALNARSLRLQSYDELASDCASEMLSKDLRRFVGSQSLARSEYASFVAVFRNSLGKNEFDFEEQLWLQLQKLNRIDAANGHRWDTAVASNPADPHFSFSFAGRAFYVIGLHLRSSRVARRFKWPTLVFNPHQQFERLRADGKWQRMQETIRTRDIRLQGNVNPMLSDFGEKSEARQYSGRRVGEEWLPPFVAENGNSPTGCPFAH